MTFTTFIRTYLGQKVDFDRAHGYQCVDLFRQYCQDVLDTEHTGPVESAKDLFLQYENNPTMQRYFNITHESELADYDKGDVLVWGKTDSNPHGHVAILVAIYNTKYFIVLEQDGFKQDGVKLAFRSRQGLLGCLWRK